MSMQLCNISLRQMPQTVFRLLQELPPKIRNQPQIFCLIYLFLCRHLLVISPASEIPLCYSVKEYLIILLCFKSASVRRPVFALSCNTCLLHHSDQILSHHHMPVQVCNGSLVFVCMKIQEAVRLPPVKFIIIHTGFS